MKKNLVITVAEKDINKLNLIADSLRNDGLDITSIYEFGVIYGIADESKVQIIKNHHEVESLREEKVITIAPPDSDIQ